MSSSLPLWLCWACVFLALCGLFACLYYKSIINMKTAKRILFDEGELNNLHYSSPFPVSKNADILVLRHGSMWLGWLYLFRCFVALRLFYGLTRHGLMRLRGGSVVLAEVLWGWAVFGGVLGVVPEPPPCVVCLGCFWVFSFLLLLYIYSWQILGGFGVSFGLFVAIIYYFSILTRACVRVRVILRRLLRLLLHQENHASRHRSNRHHYHK